MPMLIQAEGVTCLHDVICVDGEVEQLQNVEQHPSYCRIYRKLTHVEVVDREDKLDDADIVRCNPDHVQKRNGDGAFADFDQGWDVEVSTQSYS